MITEDYCSFEISKLLKEKGFDGDCGDCECHMFYCEYTEERIMPICEIGFIPDNETVFFAPTHQMAMKWLREVHHLHIDVGFGNDYKGEFLYMGDIYDLTKDAIHAKYEPIIEPDDYISTNPKTYEEAVEAALKFCLENLI